MFYRFLIPHRWRSGSRSGSRSGLKKYCSDARNSLMWFHCESVGGRFMSARLGYLWGLCLDFCNESDANVLETQHHLKVKDKRGSFSSRPKRFKKKKQFLTQSLFFCAVFYRGRTDECAWSWCSSAPSSAVGLRRLCSSEMILILQEGHLAQTATHGWFTSLSQTINSDETTQSQHTRSDNRPSVLHRKWMKKKYCLDFFQSIPLIPH